MSVRKRILAVDDDDAALGALRQILTGKGYDVSTASSAEEALAVLETESFDLLILDVAMPGMSGFELCREFRARPGSAEVPVIFLTAMARLMDMAEGDDAGSDLYLIKPVAATKLLHMVGMFLSPDAPLAKRKREADPTPEASR